MPKYSSSVRWDRKRRVFDQHGKEIIQEEEPKTIEQQIEEESHREVFCPTKGEIDLKKLRPSDIKNNPRVILAKPRSPREEAELTTRVGMVE